MEIIQAIRNIKLDPKTFKDDGEKSLDSVVQFFLDHLKKLVFCSIRAATLRRLWSWQRFNVSPYKSTRNNILLSRIL